MDTAGALPCSSEIAALLGTFPAFARCLCGKEEDSGGCLGELRSRLWEAGFFYKLRAPRLQLRLMSRCRVGFGPPQIAVELLRHLGLSFRLGLSQHSSPACISLSELCRLHALLWGNDSDAAKFQLRKPASSQVFRHINLQHDAKHCH